MTDRFPRTVFVVLIVMAAMAMAACGGSTAQTATRKVDAGEAVSMLDSRVVIDVRTAAEYAAGHIAGAQNIDVEAAGFASEILVLDRTAPVLVYCRSGRRSAIAAERMAAAGFSEIVDAGAIDDLVAAGAPLE